MTREEYRFSLFVKQIRDIIEEILIKPTWIQFCLHNHQFAGNDVLKNAIGLKWVEENLFRLAKEAAILGIASDIITKLSALNGADGKPLFPMKYLAQKYLNITDDEWKLIEKMRKEEEQQAAEAGAQQGGGMGELGGGFGDESGGGFGEFGGGGGFEEPAGGFGEEPAPEPEPTAEPEPAPEA
jgi:hypothetical protein